MMEEFLVRVNTECCIPYMHAMNPVIVLARIIAHHTPLGWGLARLSLKFELGIPYERVYLQLVNGKGIIAVQYCI